MGSNRQPKDRHKAYSQLKVKLPILIADAEARLKANTLCLHKSVSKEGKIQDLSSYNVFPPESCWLKWLGFCSDDNVCRHCYGCGAETTYRLSMNTVLVNNMVLMKEPVKEELIPIVMGPVRHFAFGDCHNLNMAKWTLAIAKKNIKHSRHIVFTKTRFYDKLRIPANTTIIGSNSIINDTKPMLKANIGKTFAAVTTLEPYINNNNYYVCKDQCINCYLNNEGCFNKEGPIVIVRLLQ